MPPTSPLDSASQDPYRLQYHFTAPKNWINDPNGLIDWRGQYHLFYQHNPFAPEWGPMHWGHAVSPDLIHWTHLPLALAPDHRTGDGDLSGIFSGSAVDDDGTLTLVYTQFTDVKAHPGAAPEVQCIARSTDGVVFTKHPGNPVIGQRPPEATAGFRDPKVWRDVDGLWKMVLGSGHQGRGMALLYSSPDLVTWTYVGPLLTGDGTTGGMWECPDLFPLGDRHVLLVSVNGPDLQATLYFVGRYDGRTFVPERHGRADWGPDFYAAQTFADRRGRRVMIGWMQRWGGAIPTQSAGWAGAMSLPRELYLLPDGALGMRPVAEVATLRRTPAPRWAAAEVAVGGPGDVPVEVQGDTLEIVAEFDPARTTATEFGLRLRRSPDGEEETVLAVHAATGTLVLDRDRSGLGDGGRYEAPLGQASGQPWRLHLFVDRSSLEVFAGDGRVVSSARIYPRRADSLGLQVYARNGQAHLVSLSVWELASIWTEAATPPAA